MLVVLVVSTLAVEALSSRGREDTFISLDVLDFLSDEGAGLYTNFKHQYTALLFIMQRVATGENFDCFSA